MDGERILKKVVFSWSEDEVPARDLALFAEHCDRVKIDGDSKTVTLVNPDDWVIEELENRGVEYRIYGGGVGV